MLNLSVKSILPVCEFLCIISLLGLRVDGLLSLTGLCCRASRLSGELCHDVVLDILGVGGAVDELLKLREPGVHGGLGHVASLVLGHGGKVSSGLGGRLLSDHDIVLAFLHHG